MIQNISIPIDIVFHQKDSGAEGGSAIWVLGTKTFLPKLLAKINPKGGKIVSDGSNSRGSTLERMLRPHGFEFKGFNLRLSDNQPFTDVEPSSIREQGKYAIKKGLYVFDVTPL